jgi:hypothetical protein
MIEANKEFDDYQNKWADIHQKYLGGSDGFDPNNAEYEIAQLEKTLSDECKKRKKLWKAWLLVLTESAITEDEMRIIHPFFKREFES